MGGTRNRGMLQLSAVLLALLALFSQLMLPLPPVPVNLTLLAVMLMGFLLPRFCAIGTVAAYLLMGGLGLPVFAGLRGGPQALFGLTGGYLLGYLLSVSLIAFLQHRAGGIGGRFALCLAALFCCYVPGTLWLMGHSGLPLLEALPLAVLPFIPGDLMKCLLAAWLSPRLQAALARAGFH